MLTIMIVYGLILCSYQYIKLQTSMTVLKIELYLNIKLQIKKTDFKIDL